MNELVQFSTITDIYAAKVNYLNECQSMLNMFNNVKDMMTAVGVQHSWPMKALLPDMATFIEEVDRACWLRVISLVGLEGIMPSREYAQMLRTMSNEPPQFTPENVRATVDSWMESQLTTLDRAIYEVFSGLGERKAHDPFMFGDRVVLHYAVRNSFGSMSLFESTYSANNVVEIDRLFRAMDGKQPRTGANSLRYVLNEKMRRKEGNTAETDYFRIRWFQNGNAHLWFTRKDLVEQLNKRLARHAGNVIPDAA